MTTGVKEKEVEKGLNQMKICRLAVIFWNFVFLFVAKAEAQYTLPDSLAAQFMPIESYYYVKPVWGQFRNKSELQGSHRFTQTYAGELMNPTYGLTIGYHRNRFEIESGIMNLPVATGFLFQFQPINGTGATGIGEGRRITYTQVPVVARYTIWQPGKRLDLRASAGLGLIWEASKITFNFGGTTITSVTGPNGIPQITKTTTQKGHKESFQIGMIELDLQYKLGQRWGANLAVNRLFGQPEIVWMDSTVEPHGETVSYTTRAVGSANGFAFQVGLQYQFQFRKNYRFVDQDN